MRGFWRVLTVVGVALAVMLGLSLWGVVKVMAPDPHVFLETRSPGGTLTAHLERPGGTMEPIYYTVKVTGAQTCTAAELKGLQAERWVRLSWAGETLVVRYGLPDDLNAKAVAPKSKNGAEGCHGMGVRVVEDPTLSVSGPLSDAIEPAGNAL